MKHNAAPLLIVAAIAVKIVHSDIAHLGSHYRLRKMRSLWYRRNFSSGTKRRGAEIGAFSNRHKNDRSRFICCATFHFRGELYLEIQSDS